MAGKKHPVRRAPRAIPTIAAWSRHEAEYAARRPSAAPTWQEFADLPVPDGDFALWVTRARDLVTLLTVWHGVEITPATAGRTAVIEAGAGATLAVHLPFQHAQERAWYETDADARRADPLNPNGTPIPATPSSSTAAFRRGPADFRAARGTRLVFDLPEGTRVDVASQPILSLLPTLTMRVHDLATGYTESSYPPPPARVPGLTPRFVRLAEDLLVRISDGRATISVPTARQRTQYPLASDRASRAALEEWTAQLRSALPDLTVRITDAVPVARLPRWLAPDVRPRRPARDAVFSTSPAADRTAIEAPFRLVLSPDVGARWVHATAPVRAPGDARNVELWHSRLGRMPTDADAPAVPTDAPARERVVRAIWTRDRDHLPAAEWQSPDSDWGDEGAATGFVGPLAPPASPDRDRHPFPSSLNRSDRHRLVRQTSETIGIQGAGLIRPNPISAHRLWLSAFGATLDLHGHWDTTPYSQANIPSILAWDHLASFGRDQFVRVVYPGYLFPLGHKAVLVKITERKIRLEPRAPKRPIAGLFTKQFVAVIERDRSYSQRDLPFRDAHLGTAVTPALDPPGSGESVNSFFWPVVAESPFRFRVEATDQGGGTLPFTAPLLWVAAHNNDFSAVRDEYHGVSGTAEKQSRRVIDLGARVVTLYRDPVDLGADARSSADLPVERFRLTGDPKLGTSEPHIGTADVVIEAARTLADTPPTTIVYHPEVIANTRLNTGGVWAVTAVASQLSKPAYANRLHGDPVVPLLPAVRFGEPQTGVSPGKSSESGGGFVAPSQIIAGLSTTQGTVADVASGEKGTLETTDLASPEALAALGAALPRLFGLVALTDLLAAVEAPELLATLMEPLAQLASSLERARMLAQNAQGAAQTTSSRLVADAQQKVTDAAGGALASAQAFFDQQKHRAETLVTDAEDLTAAVENLVNDVLEFLENLATLDLGAAETQFDAFRADMAAIARRLRDLGVGLLPPIIRQQLAGVATTLDDIRASSSVVKDVFQAATLAKSLAGGAKQIELRFDWAPELHDWPATRPVIEFAPWTPGDHGKPKKALTISVNGRAGVGTTPALDILAELGRFRLTLLPVEPLVEIEFEHLTFHSGTSGKTEVDVELGAVRFVGILSFVETIKELIPFDGFSDPPHVAVDVNGLTAGYTLALPNVAIGVFALSNMSLSADLRVPFLGDALSVGFGFCSRERPFTLAVVFLGGGGWFGMRLSPKRLELLEVGLEAGAYLSVDFGVASGSISAAIGIYLRLEGDKGSLTGYFRLRGEVDVLGLISASIELAMSLTYDFHEQKVIGRASITVEVEVLCFSQSVTIEAERKFAGSNGDPSVRQLLAGGTEPWTDYLDAFAMEEP